MMFFKDSGRFFSQRTPFCPGWISKKNFSYGWFLYKALLALILGILAFGSLAVYADTPIPLPNPILGATTLTDVLTKIVNYLNLIVDPLIVLMVLWGGLQILMGGADEAKFKEGKNTIKYAAIGAIVIICASGLVYLVAEVMKVSLP